MPKVFFDISMSLDGFMTAACTRPDEPMGDGGNLLHHWAYLRANLIDELSLYVVPVLFGSGTRMFDAVTESHRPLELVSVIHTSTALHLRARIVR